MYYFKHDGIGLNEICALLGCYAALSGGSELPFYAA
jgi:hypothetical protein